MHERCRVEVGGGLDAIRLTGQGARGDPAGRDQALSLLRQAVHIHGTTRIDAADAYDPHTGKHLIRDALTAVAKAAMRTDPALLSELAAALLEVPVVIRLPTRRRVRRICAASV